MRNIRRICRSCSAQVLTQVPECVRCKSLQSSVSLLQIQNAKMTQSCPSAPQSMHTPQLQPAAVMCPLSIRQNGPAYQHRHRFQTSSSKHLPTFAGIVHFEQREDSIQIRETPFSCYAQEIFHFPHHNPGTIRENDSLDYNAIIQIKSKLASNETSNMNYIKEIELSNKQGTLLIKGLEQKNLMKILRQHQA